MGCNTGLAACRKAFTISYRGLLLSPRFTVSNVNSRPFASVAPEDDSSRIRVGARFSTKRRFSPEEVKSFAALSDDHNPIHLDEAYAATTKFKRPIVHGMLANSLFSGLLARHLGPGAVLLSLECIYQSPVFVGEEITAEIEIKEISGLRVLTGLRCTSNSTNKVLIEGTARGVLPRRSDPSVASQKLETEAKPQRADIPPKAAG